MPRTMKAPKARAVRDVEVFANPGRYGEQTAYAKRKEPPQSSEQEWQPSQDEEIPVSARSKKRAKKMQIISSDQEWQPSQNEEDIPVPARSKKRVKKLQIPSDQEAQMSQDDEIEIPAPAKAKQQSLSSEDTWQPSQASQDDEYVPSSSQLDEIEEIQAWQSDESIQDITPRNSRRQKQKIKRYSDTHDDDGRLRLKGSNNAYTAGRKIDPYDRQFDGSAESDADESVFDKSVGGDESFLERLPTAMLRSECNRLGESCRYPGGSYLPRSKLIQIVKKGWGPLAELLW